MAYTPQPKQPLLTDKVRLDWLDRNDPYFHYKWTAGGYRIIRLEGQDGGELGLGYTVRGAIDMAIYKGLARPDEG